MRIRTVLAKLTLLAGSGALALCAAEVALRLLGHPPPPPEDNLRTFTTYDPELGWKGPPRASGLYRTRGVTTEVALNSGGWRDDEPASARRPAGGSPEVPLAPDRERDGTTVKPVRAQHPAEAGPAGSASPPPPLLPAAVHKDIVLLGDSFAWGYGVNRGEMFADQVERLLPGFQIRNLAISGFGTDQELLALRRFGLDPRPDIVVVQFAVENDIYTILTNDAYNLPKPRFVLLGGTLSLEGVPVPKVANWENESRGSAAKAFLTRNIRLYAWARPRWAALREKVSGLFGRDPEDVVASRRVRLLATTPGTRIEEGWRLAEALLAAIHQEAARAGARTVLLEVPDRLQVDDELWEDAVRAFGLDRGRYDRTLPEKRLRAITERAGIGYVELLDPLRRTMSAGENVFLAEDIHWNATGHKIAAEELARALAPTP